MTAEGQQPVAVDLFCGAGGASCGIHAAGFDLRAAVDHDETALQTHHENLPSEPVLHDLTDVDPTVLPADARDPDYVHGSPPCKGFSNANDSRNADDPRNALVFDYVDWLREFQPKVATMENVRGMRSITDHFMDRLMGAFRDAGYEPRWKLLNAADYGVPQTRRRIITVAVRDDVEKPSRWYPSPTHAESANQTTLDGRRLESWVTVQQAIGDLPGVESVEQHKNGGEGSPATARGGSRPAHTVTGAGNHIAMTDQINETHQREGRRPLQSIDEPSNTIRAGTPPALVTADGGVRNHVAQDHSSETRQQFAELAPGETNEGMSNRRLDPDAPSPTITADEGAAVPPVHYQGPVLNHDPREATDSEPSEWEYEEPAESLMADARLPDKDRAPGAASSQWEGARRLTVRECARLQAFPDWFVFTGTKTSQYAQVGNAVPPALQYHVVTHLRSEVLGS